MLAILLKVLLVVAMLTVLICIKNSMEYFDTLPSSNRFKVVLAWDIIILMMLGFYLVVKIITF